MGLTATHVRALIWKLSFGRMFFAGFLGGTAFIQAEVPFSLYRGGSPTHFPPARPAGGRAAPCVGCRAAGQDTKKAGYPEGYPKPEWGVQRGETLPSGVLSSISHRRNGGRRQAPPRGAAPRGRFGGTARRVRYPRGPGPRPHGAGSNLRCVQMVRRPDAAPPPATKKDLANRPGPFCCVIVALDERGIPIRRCPAPS